MKHEAFFGWMVTIFLTMGLFLPSSSQGQLKAELVGERMVAFYPDGFVPEETLPSFSLISEPDSLGPIPAGWSLKPDFIMEEGKYAAYINIDEGTHLYGTGEVFGDLLRNHTEVIMWNTDNYGYFYDDAKRLYQSHPWILGLRTDGSSFGILIDHSWKQTFFLDNPIRVVSEGPPFRLFVIERNHPAEVVMTLAELTGTLELPPIWALGYHQCRYSYYPDNEVKELADTFREKSLPCDVIWMDIDYMDGYRVFTFDPVGFPDPLATNQYLHENDFHSIWMIDPGVKNEAGYFVYDQGSAEDLWVKTISGNTYVGEVWPGDCVFPDFTMPITRSWWSGLYQDFMAQGIDGVWNDMNEPAVFNGPDKTMPENNMHRGGGDLPADIHRRYHNVYGMLMVQATRQGVIQAKPGLRPFVLTRAGFLGSHRYAATWTGDNVSSWDHLKMSIPMSLNLSLSGQAFNGPDVGGFVGSPGAELLGHWMALGAFYPFYRNHTSSGTNPQEPWAYGPEIEEVSRVALERRYRLLPYLYSRFYLASTTGMPIMQPLFFADPQDPDLREEQECFLFGDHLLIEPIWASPSKLPKGNWRKINIINDERENDGYQPRIYQKEGTVVPIGSLIQSTEDYSTEQVILLISPDEDLRAEGMLYADAGNGYEHLEGGFLQTGFQVSPAGPDSLQVYCYHMEGDMSVDNRSYQAVLVTHQGLYYFDPTFDTLFHIPLISDLKISWLSPEPDQLYEIGESVPLKIQLEGGLEVDQLSFLINDTIHLPTLYQPPWEADWEPGEKGLYTLTARIIAADTMELYADTRTIQIGTFGTGTITYERWNDIGGGVLVSDLISIPEYPNQPDEIQYLNSFESPQHSGDEYGARLIGYLAPPVSTEYTFWIAGDDYCELWLSSDAQESNKQLIAEVPGWTFADEWQKYPEQMSANIFLEKDKNYFIMGLQKEAYNDDFIKVAWSYEGQNRQTIPGTYLSPYGFPDAVTETNSLPALKIYPNPANEQLYIETLLQKGTVNIFNMDGVLMKRWSIQVASEAHTLYVGDLQAGVYLVSFTNDSASAFKKLVLNK